MNKFHLILHYFTTFVFLTLILFSNRAFSISSSQASLVSEFQNLGNPSFNNFQQASELIPIEHYEIPISALANFRIEDFPSDIREHFVFEKNGQTFIRWLVNPKETTGNLPTKRFNREQWVFISFKFQELEEWLKAKGLSTKRHHYFMGYFTASRSIYLVSPDKNLVISAKTS